MAKNTLQLKRDALRRSIVALEEMRTNLCAYKSKGSQRCDCKFSTPNRDELRFEDALSENGGLSGIGIFPAHGNSEVTGCPELRTAIGAMKVLLEDYA